jgi:hypothetical protein
LNAVRIRYPIPQSPHGREIPLKIMENKILMKLFSKLPWIAAYMLIFEKLRSGDRED